MRREHGTRWALLGALALAGCDLIEAPAPPRCVAVAGEATPSVTVVCARLNALECRLPDCEQAYAGYQSRVSPAEFNRLTSCYLHATSCDEVGQCELACGADGGMVTVNPPTDAGTDVGSDVGSDAGTDVGSDSGVDAAMDLGSDVGSDAGSDAGTDVGMDGGSDAGVDVGSGGGTDAGTDVGSDGGSDAAVSDAGADAAD